MSAINVTKPEDDSAALTADLRANWVAAANEIDANTAAAAAALSAANTHAARTDNPHATTAAQVGADATGTAAAAVAAHVALADPHTQYAETTDLAAYVPTTRTVNGQALSANVTLTKSDVGLGSADNTADTAKPVSTAQQTALNLKANLASPTFTGTVTLPAGQVVNGVTLVTGGGTSNFLRADGTYAAPGDMVLASAQTVNGAKTFNDATLLLNNVAGTFAAKFSNTNTANRTYTLKDANGTIAFTSDITGTNSGTNTGDQTITLTGGVTGSGTGSFAATVVTNANLTGPVTSTGNATAIANGAISNAMLANAAVGNLSGTNTGDNAVNSLYSGLVSNATHTGDVTGDTALTLATVNSNVGSFTNANITVNAKGLVTAASTGSGGSGGTDNYTTHVIQGII